MTTTKNSPRQTSIAVVIGSTRSGRFGPTVAHWFADQAARREDVRVDLVDLAESRLPDAPMTQPAPEAVRALSFHNVSARFDAKGQPTDPDRFELAARSLLDQLAWWSDALREARARRPYPA